MNILLIQEDEKSLSYIKKGLLELGYIVDAVFELTDALKLFYTENYNLIISDTSVNGINAINLLKKVRKNNEKVGFIFLTSDSYSGNIIECFEAGIDDYIIKPFIFREFICRVKAVLKREINTINNTYTLKIKDIEVNILKREVKKNGHLVSLTPKEFLILKFLLENKNLHLSRTIIKEKIWGVNFLNKTNIVDVHINKIRNKLSDDKNQIITTTRGLGYKIVEEKFTEI